MSLLRFTTPFTDTRNADTTLRLSEYLAHHPSVFGNVGCAEAGYELVAIVENKPTRFLLVDGIYYIGFDGSDWLDTFEVGDFVEVRLVDRKLKVKLAGYPMAQFDLGYFLSFVVGDRIDQALARLHLQPREFDTGVKLYDIAKAPNKRTRIVIYDIPAGAPPEAFSAHRHIGGEVFYVVCGEVTDQHGTYGPGILVTIGANTVHHPTTKGRTVIVVTWTDGIEEVPK